MICSVPDCQSHAVAHGYCDKHYRRLKKWGSPLGATADQLFAARSQAAKRREANRTPAERAAKTAHMRAGKPPRSKMECVECGKPFECVRHEARSRKFCSRSCYRKSVQRNGRPSVRESRTCEFCGGSFAVQPKRQKARRFCSVRCKARWQASLPYPEWRGKLSSNRANRASGPKNGMWGKTAPHGKPVTYHALDGRIVRLRSRWEAAVAAYLDAVGVDWEYEPRRFILRDRTYTPDFWLPAVGVFWEVKGWLHDRHAETIRQFREAHPRTPLVVVGLGSISGIAAAVGHKLQT